MKTTLLVVTILMSHLSSPAQSKTTTALFNEIPLAAIETNIPFEVALVEKAIEEKMSRFNVKARDQKGYKAYRGVRIDSISDKEIDLYFKTVRKGRKDKDASIVTMLVSSGFEVFMNQNANPEEFDRARIFMNSLLQNSAAADLDVQIGNQDEAVKKADKKLELLRDELNELRKKLKYTAEKFADTEKEILKQEDQLRKEKEIQHSLQNRRNEHK